MIRSMVGIALSLGLAATSLAEPFWGARTSMPAGTDPASLKPGEFVWEGDAVPSGPVVVVVSVTEQRASIYRNGVRIGVSTVSTGRAGHETPTGVFHVLQKDRTHHSKKYNNAPMPDAERLTWDGVALHAGGLPGYPSSHGCIHLPSRVAELLFDASAMGMTVVIGSEGTAPEDVVHPAALAPVDAATGAEDAAPRLAAGEASRWEPEKAPAGPVSIVASRADRRVVVYRNGVEIGRATIDVQDPDRPLGTRAFVMLESASAPGDVAAAAGPATRWSAVALPGYAASGADPAAIHEAARIRMPTEFRRGLAEILAPGTTFLVTDAPILEENSGVPLKVIHSGSASES